MKSRCKGAVAAICVCISFSLWPSAAAPAKETEPALGILDAVRCTLQRHPEIRLAQEAVRASQGALEVASGSFDTNILSSLSQRGDPQPAQPSITTLFGTLFSVGLNQQFRWGMSAASSLQVSHLAQPGTDQSAGQARLLFALIQPLLRGRGASSAAASERAAEIDWRESELELQHTIAVQVFATAAAYWNYVAAREAVTIRQAAEDRADLLLAQENRLVKAREHAAAELKKLEANLADARAARIDAERQTLEARQALGVVMGLPWRESGSLPAPRDPFAVVPRGGVPPIEAVPRLVEAALKRRPDYLAAQTAIRAAQVRAIGARRNLEPQMDLSAQLGYAVPTAGSGMDMLLGPSGYGPAGVSFFTGLSFQLPLQNRAARGLLRQREAEQRRAEILLDDLRRRIGAALALSLESLRTEALRLESTQLAIAAYREAVSNERKRLRAGLSTIFDVLLTESRLTSAELNGTEARLRVAMALLRLRFESGTLIEPAGDWRTIGMDQLTRLPP